MSGAAPACRGRRLCVTMGPWIRRIRGPMLKKFIDLFSQEIWHRDVYSMSRSRRIFTFWVRMGHIILEEVISGDLRMRAMGLVYMSILSLVPFMAFAFSVLKGLGFQNKLQPMLVDMFDPLGPRGAEIAGKVIDF